MLEDPRHEAFARGLFEGKSQEQAYADAGYSPKNARSSASRLLSSNDNIMRRVIELGKKAEAQAIWTMADAMNKLAALADENAIKSEEAAIRSVARASIMDYAKLSGWVVDKAATANVSLDDLLNSIADKD